MWMLDSARIWISWVLWRISVRINKHEDAIHLFEPAQIEILQLNEWRFVRRCRFIHSLIEIAWSLTSWAHHRHTHTDMYKMRTAYVRIEQIVFIVALCALNWWELVSFLLVQQEWNWFPFKANICSEFFEFVYRTTYKMFFIWKI